MRFCCLLCILLVCVLSSRGQQPPGPPQLAVVQDTGYLVVRSVNIIGNKKTRNNIILRELSIVPGDTIRLKNLSATLEAGRKQLINTALFLNVTANVKNWEGNEADIVFEVWERWYTFAFPIFRLADRNFNQWWVEQRRSLNRVNIGVKGFLDNLTGRNDDVYATVQFGYTQQLSLSYNVPYIDKTFRHGLGFSISYSRNREVNDSSNRNKQNFYRQDNFLRQLYSFGIGYTYRRAINTRHQVFLNYNYEKIDDSVALRNPRYLGGGRTRVQYMELIYRMTYIKADSWIYPLKGVYIQAEASRQGIPPLNDLSYWRFRARITRYWELFPKTWGALGLRGQAKFSPDQPYVNQRAIGYGEDYLRGLEYYVVDGTSYFILKSTLRRELVSFQVKLPLVPKKFNTVPIRILAKAYADGGYAYTNYPGNGFLNNRFLYTGGVGLDIVSFYDTCLRIEYSVNQLGQKGLFLHTKLDM